MSKPTFPLLAGDPSEDEAGPRAGRRLPLAVGGLGVVALAVIGVLVLGGGDDDALGLGLPTGTPASAGTPAPSATPATPEAPAPVSAEVRRGRDPFLSPAGATSTSPAGAPAGSEVATGAGGGAAPGTGSETGSDTSSGTGGGQSAAGPLPEGGAGPVAGPVTGTAPVGSGREEQLGPRSVSLLGVGATQTAELAVDGVRQSVRVGGAFGPGGALLLLSVQSGPEDGQWTAVVQQGSGDPFDVVTGRPASLV